MAVNIIRVHWFQSDEWAPASSYKTLELSVGNCVTDCSLHCLTWLCSLSQFFWQLLILITTALYSHALLGVPFLSSLSSISGLIGARQPCAQWKLLGLGPFFYLTLYSHSFACFNALQGLLFDSEVYSPHFKKTLWTHCALWVCQKSNRLTTVAFWVLAGPYSLSHLLGQCWSLFELLLIYLFTRSRAASIMGLIMALMVVWLCPLLIKNQLKSNRVVLMWVVDLTVYIRPDSRQSINIIIIYPHRLSLSSFSFFLSILVNFSVYVWHLSKTHKAYSFCCFSVLPLDWLTYSWDLKSPFSLSLSLCLLSKTSRLLTFFLWSLAALSANCLVLKEPPWTLVITCN